MEYENVKMKRRNLEGLLPGGKEAETGENEAKTNVAKRITAVFICR